MNQEYFEKISDIMRKAQEPMQSIAELNVKCVYKSTGPTFVQTNRCDSRNATHINCDIGVHQWSPITIDSVEE